jgi:hypothetical protein
MADKKYYIEIFYETGDSFSKHDEYSNIGLTWDKLDIAKENLRRIKEHYEWYDYENSYMSRYKEEKVKKPKCADKEYDFCIHLVTDDGEDCKVSAFWCGYFETLYSATIKESKDPEMYYVVGDN